MNRNDREIRRLCLDVVLLDGEQDAAPSLADMARRAKALLDGALAPRKRVARDVRAVDLRPTKEQRKDERRRKVAEIREAVFVRADGRCECCCNAEPTEWHHVVSGGLRRHAESFETTAAVCFLCHLELHRGDHGALCSMRLWARVNGFARAQAAIEHRIAKVSEARAPRGGRA
jgi:hypothetical protein